jgi:protein TonB
LASDGSDRSAFERRASPPGDKVAWTLAASLLLHLAALAWLPSWGQDRSQAHAAPAALSVRLALAPAAAAPAVAAAEPTVRAVSRRAARRPVVPLRPEPSSPSLAAPLPEPEPRLAPAAPPRPSVTEEALPLTVPDLRVAYASNPPPNYPRAARRLGLEGRVVLRAEILATGGCGQIAVSRSSGHAVLDDAALQAVKGWRFVPATRGGQAVAAWVEVPVTFRLDGRDR